MTRTYKVGGLGVVGVAPEFKIPSTELLRLCEQELIDIRVICTLRLCEEQARLYRRSRTRTEIEQKAQSLNDRGYTFLADVLLSVGPQPGKLGLHVTNAAPGESWHQYGLAIDCVPFSGGKPLWDASAEEWQVYGRCARYLGLTWAGDWSSFKEFPHVQLHATKSPLSYFKTPSAVEAALKEIGAL